MGFSRVDRHQELGEEGHASSDQEQKLRTFRLLDDFLQRRVGGAVEATADDGGPETE